MATYELGHLNQAPGTVHLGPIQDDEALILYAICKAVRVRRVLELGGLSGYSARNFIAAGCYTTTVEMNGMTPVEDTHRVIHANCADVAEHVEGFFDLVFFDAHDYRAETKAFNTLTVNGCITPETIIGIHDTGFHAEELVPSEHTANGWLHNPPARDLRDYLVARGCTELFLPTFHGLSLLRWTS